MNNTEIQQRAINKLNRLKVGALFMALGTGKTKVAFVGMATASHLDFCRYQFRCLRPHWSYNEYMKMLTMFIELFFALLSIPFLVLTHGLILYPFWIVVHILKVKKIVKEFAADRINSEAEKLVKEFREVNNENHNAD